MPTNSRGAEPSLNPRYEGPAIIEVGDLVADPSEPFIRQRKRLAEVMSLLSSEEWASPSRCEGWSVQDVAEHLAGVNQFFLLSIGSGLRDEPSQLLASFDPVKVPAAMVERARGAAPAATLERLIESNGELAALLSSVPEDDWAKPAEAPPGHIAVRAVCAHALWDAWIHERDVLLPLGLNQQIETDEVEVALGYAAALGVAFYLISGAARSGSLAVETQHPALAFTVDVGEQVNVRLGAQPDATALVKGEAVDLLEGFSCRGPHPRVPIDHRWLVDGLHQVFDVSG
jgi:uncharacterized protein (TIGR03083 family)